MLVGLRSYLLPLLALVFCASASIPVRSQVNGVPPSVTSFGFGGSTNPTPGVRASVTSLGPNGLGNNRAIFGNCCTSFFWPPNSYAPLFPDSGHHRKDRDKDRDRDKNHDYFAVGLSEPAYIPYPVPYADSDADDSSDADYAQDPGARSADQGRHPAGRNKVVKNSVPDQTIPAEPEEPVAAQPSTVLVFKDGHESDVLNYAIVGDTLFDFASGRTKKILLADLNLTATRKANDDRGVDFQIPANSSPH